MPPPHHETSAEADDGASSHHNSPTVGLKADKKEIHKDVLPHEDSDNSTGVTSSSPDRSSVVHHKQQGGPHRSAKGLHHDSAAKSHPAAGHSGIATAASATEHHETHASSHGHHEDKKKVSTNKKKKKHPHHQSHDHDHEDHQQHQANHEEGHDDGDDHSHDVDHHGINEQQRGPPSHADDISHNQKSNFATTDKNVAGEAEDSKELTALSAELQRLKKLLKTREDELTESLASMENTLRSRIGEALKLHTAQVEHTHQIELDELRKKMLDTSAEK